MTEEEFKNMKTLLKEAKEDKDRAMVTIPLDIFEELLKEYENGKK